MKRSFPRLRNPLGTGAVVLILALVFCLLNFRQSSAEEVNEINIKDWQLISSSTASASGPGVDTYMKSYPGETVLQTDYRSKHFMTKSDEDEHQSTSRRK